MRKMMLRGRKLEVIRTLTVRRPQVGFRGPLKDIWEGHSQVSLLGDILNSQVVTVAHPCSKELRLGSNKFHQDSREVHQ